MNRARCLAFAVTLLAGIQGCQRGDKSARPDAGTTPPRSVAATKPAMPAADERPLFDRLGGMAGVTKVVDDFVATAAADPKVNFSRKGHPAAWEATPQNVTMLKKRLVEFLATATGGDVNYAGKDMVTAHRGMRITDAEFDALAGHLRDALAKHDVPASEQSELMAVVNRTRSAIVAVTPDAAAPAKPVAPMKTEAPAKTETPAPFVPQPVTSDETELEDEPAPAAAKKPAIGELNK